MWGNTRAAVPEVSSTGSAFLYSSQPNWKEIGKPPHPVCNRTRGPREVKGCTDLRWNDRPWGAAVPEGMDLGGVHVLGPSLHDQLCEKVSIPDCVVVIAFWGSTTATGGNKSRQGENKERSPHQNILYHGTTQR